MLVDADDESSLASMSKGGFEGFRLHKTDVRLVAREQVAVVSSALEQHVLATGITVVRCGVDSGGMSPSTAQDF